MAEELRDLGLLEDEMRDVAEVVVTESLHNLRYEEECEVYRMLRENTMRVLEDDGIVLVTRLVERDCGHGWCRVPNEQILPNC